MCTSTEYHRSIVPAAWMAENAVPERGPIQGADMAALRLDFLKATQAGALDQVQKMFAADPSMLEARSTSKGYSAVSCHSILPVTPLTLTARPLSRQMHFAAMGGSLSLIEWLVAQGLPTEIESPSGVSPIQVALEYKRLPAARLLQQLRAAGGKVPADATLDIRSPQADSSVPPIGQRPAARHPAWICSGGIAVHELEGATEEAAAEAVRLASEGATVIWRRARLCPGFPPDVHALGLDSLSLDTNVSPRSDRKFVYFAPQKLERGPYEPVSLEREFAPMLLNQPMKLGKVAARHAAHARREREGGGGGGSDGGSVAGAGTAPCQKGETFQSGWIPPRAVGRGDEAVYVMHKLLEIATPKEVSGGPPKQNTALPTLLCEAPGGDGYVIAPYPIQQI